MTYTYKYNSKLGDIMLASNGEALTELWFDGQKHLCRENTKKKLCRFLRKPQSGLIYIFLAKIPIIHRYCLLILHLFVDWYEKYFLQFRVEKL